MTVGRGSWRAGCASVGKCATGRIRHMRTGMCGKSSIEYIHVHATANADAVFDQNNVLQFKSSVSQELYSLEEKQKSLLSD